ncbi:MAG TPA: DUF4340 domain-containing protein [Spirochaetia bacterium]|nr:DUF4340 domain-containing protein [Spirochaetia bacterium]
MMNFRKRVISLVVANGILALLLIIGAFSSLQARGLAPITQSVFPSLRPAEVSRVTVTHAGTTLELNRQTVGNWTVKSGASVYPAEPTQVTNFLSDLSTLQTIRSVTESTSLYSTFKLDNADAYRIDVIQSGGPSLTLYYGKDEVGGGYIRIGNDPAVYLADHSLAFYLASGSQGWYDLRLFPANLTYSDVQELDVAFLPGIDSAQRGLVVLQGKPDPRLPASIRTRGYRLARRSTNADPNTWFFEGDLSIPLDQPQVESVSRELVTLQGSSFAAVGAVESGIAHPGIRVTATTGTGSTYILNIGRSAGKDTFYVQPEGPGVFTDSAGKPYVYVISRWYLQRLLKPIDDLEQQPAASGK